MALISCSHDGFKNDLCKDDGFNVLFLHHSTGGLIYKGGSDNDKSVVDTWFEGYNKSVDHKINFQENIFPQSKKLKILGYGWKNYPYDYYNIWVKNGKKNQYKNEPTLKVLTTYWDVIIIKHCYPVSNMVEGYSSDINSSEKTLANYKLQYEALKKKFYEYPETKFIIWTGAALVEQNTSEEKALRAKEFFSWVKNEWDSPNDNIFIWDFYELETEGGLYLKDEYAVSPTNSHPNSVFAAKVAPLFCQRIIDVILHDGNRTSLTGEYLLK